MVMTRSTAVGSIVTGSIMLCFAIATVICGAIASKKLSGQVAASAGLWSLYYAVPGILSIVAGASKNGVVMGFALFFNICAVIVSSVASVILLLFTIALNEYYSNQSECISVFGKCQCGTDTWDFKCSDFDTLHTIMIAMLAVYIILSIVTFMASIFGCLGTCCAPIDPVVVVTTGVPVHTGGTVVVSSNQSSVHGFMPPAMPSAHGYPQPPAYGDKAGLVRNMAI